jgi:hypothetical protein
MNNLNINRQPAFSCICTSNFHLITTVMIDSCWVCVILTIRSRCTIVLTSDKIESEQQQKACPLSNLCSSQQHRIHVMWITCIMYWTILIGMEFSEGKTACINAFFLFCHCLTLLNLWNSTDLCTVFCMMQCNLGSISCCARPIQDYCHNALRVSGV